MSKTKLKKQYFKIDNEQVIYPASIFARIGARIIDFVLISVLTFILLIIYIPTSTTSISNATNFGDVVYGQYNPVVMLGWSLSIVLAIVFLIIIPFFNKENSGQTIGKKVMKITPLYVGKGSEKLSYILRELPIITFFILPTIFSLALGYDAASFYSQYRVYLQHSDSTIVIMPKNSFDFFSNFWGAAVDPNGILQFDGVDLSIGTAGVAMAYSQLIASYIFLFIIFSIWISMLFESQKRGYHDLYAKTAVVDLRTITTLQKAEQQYNELMGNFVSSVENVENETIKLDVENEKTSDFINENEKNNNIVQDKPIEDKPIEDKPIEDKPTEDKPSEDKPNEGKPKENNNLSESDSKPNKKNNTKEKNSNGK